RAVGARVLLDGAQRVPHGPVDVPALGVDFYAFSGHKMFAPTGIGALWGRRELLDAMPPFLGGGEMIRSVAIERTVYADVPHKFEAGTPPIAQAIGLGATAEWLMRLDWPAVSAHEMRLAQRALDGLGGIAGLRIVGPQGLQARLPVISFALNRAHPHDICQILDGFGVALRGGHHCAQPFMDSLGLAGTTRASIALYNDARDIDALIEGVGAAARRPGNHDPRPRRGASRAPARSRRQRHARQSVMRRPRDARRQARRRADCRYPPHGARLRLVPGLGGDDRRGGP
ncbi:MAG: aminotransferase class V-fold PLP-dependent enzyme, partial [Rhodospirillales bacterium]|nr:aminotransferase class V-fold PLP-dependent enzyme [Rhodospirillales bacterium]